jgi:hypothetical protein
MVMRTRQLFVWACLVAGVPAIASGQARQGATPDQAREIEKANRAYQARSRAEWVAAPPDVLNAPVVADAPFSADATTTVTQVLGDGTRIEQTTSARFFRDRAGRVRREQTIIGLGAVNGAGSAQTITIDPDPSDGMAYTLDPVTRTAMRVPRVVFSSFNGAIRINSANGAFMLNGAPAVAVAGRGTPARGPDVTTTFEMLGTRQFDGVSAVGRKTTTTIPTGQIGNDRPIETTDERWESAELRILVYSRTSDPRTGVVEYRLTNINRSEPPPDLFEIPPGYSLPVERAAPAGLGRGGARGAGGRGAPQ